MYDLPRHKEQERSSVLEFIERYPFAFLTGTNHEGKPVATQIPLLLEEGNDKQVLIGHLMKNTDHHRAFLENEDVLAVFTGKHTYVSGSWYRDPHTASTWNYMSVHVRGQIRFLPTPALEAVLRKTTLHFEDQNRQSPTVFDNLPETFKHKVMHAIVAFEIEVQDMDTVFKLSQDRDEESYQNIVDRLSQQGEDGRVIAMEMIKRKHQLFSTH